MTIILVFCVSVHVTRDNYVHQQLVLQPHLYCYECHDNSYCLRPERMCDGVRDCRDESDEGPFCDNCKCIISFRYYCPSVDMYKILKFCEAFRYTTLVIAIRTSDLRKIIFTQVYVHALTHTHLRLRAQ